MLKLALTATTAAVAGIAAATAFGFANAKPHVIYLKVHDVASLKSDNFQCQALSAKQAACGANILPNSVQVFFAPHQVAVLQFDKTGKKATYLLNMKR